MYKRSLNSIYKPYLFLLAVLVVLFSSKLSAQDTQAKTNLVDSIKLVKPSIVGIARYTPIDAKAPVILGTGFVVADGKHIVTNYHVVSKELDSKKVQHYVALSGKGANPKIHIMTIKAVDPVHDLALLSIEKSLPALALAGDELIDDGTSVFFTGFPIGAVLGLYPATHTGIIAATTPDINPAKNASELTVQMLNRLQKPFYIYQLDATAYPGNSGSPLVNQDTNEVIAVINKVFVSEGKESALTNPSGITYAIPIRELRKLAKTVDITL
ncbi:trypsin-like peptidase domain-containing protein [Glaciecola sp. MH2013]|uniref:S1 family peptidase n=1 Tax=Glaciecola sp. MH2013 TaxID=2785524 RepID=UPI00189EED46|nr:serine protease [Glaciecola sp. MH2013]MBF7072175.1 trypsin-like peptidase domain-containing protein [Glaciecola sp. MH2013]